MLRGSETCFKIILDPKTPCGSQTSSAIADIDDGPHGASTHYIITKPHKTFLKTDRPTDKVTYKDDYPSSKKGEA